MPYSEGEVEKKVTKEYENEIDFGSSSESLSKKQVCEKAILIFDEFSI